MTDWGHLCWPGQASLLPPVLHALLLLLTRHYGKFGRFSAIFVPLSWNSPDFLGTLGSFGLILSSFLLLGAELRRIFLEIFHGDIWYLSKRNKRVSIAVKFIKQNLSGFQKVPKQPPERVKRDNSPRAKMSDKITKEQFNIWILNFSWILIQNNRNLNFILLQIL